MKNKFTRQLSDEDIKAILSNCGYTLCENLKDNEGNIIPAIERNVGEDKKTMVRCIAPDEVSEHLKNLMGALLKANPVLFDKVFASAHSPYNVDFELLVLEDFIAWFPFEINQSYEKSKKVHQAFIDYGSKKFGKEFDEGYDKYKEKIFAEENIKEGEMIDLC